jgi:hypothetical protein
MTDINIGALTEALNDKTDRDMRNVDNTAGADAVIEYRLPTAENNYTWYRKYKSGWVEQGGHDTTTRTTSAASSAGATVVFPVEFSDTNYTFNATVNGTYCGIQEKAGYTRTTTDLKVDILACYPNNTYTSKGFDWFACGMAAN